MTWLSNSAVPQRPVKRSSLLASLSPAAGITARSRPGVGASVEQASVSAGAAAPTQPQATPLLCPGCVRLEEKLERLEEERRELNAENRRLWKENSELNARAARLEEQQKKTDSAGFSERDCPAA